MIEYKKRPERGVSLPGRKKKNFITKYYPNKSE